MESGGGVSQEEVFRVFGENTERLRALLLRVAARCRATGSAPARTRWTASTLHRELP